VGTGFAAADGALGGALAERLIGCDAAALPRAAAVARIALAAHARGEAISADQLQPAYLRDKVAQTLLERGKA
jgi:tRNA threonylcarbamoyladenosine biosynthesis protein TsaB